MLTDLLPTSAVLCHITKYVPRLAKYLWLAITLWCGLCLLQQLWSQSKHQTLCGTDKNKQKLKNQFTLKTNEFDINAGINGEGAEFLNDACTRGLECNLIGVSPKI